MMEEQGNLQARNEKGNEGRHRLATEGRWGRIIRGEKKIRKGVAEGTPRGKGIDCGQRKRAGSGGIRDPHPGGKVGIGVTRTATPSIVSSRKKITKTIAVTKEKGQIGGGSMRRPVSFSL